MSVYLLHFDRRLSDHAGHYLGSADNVPARLADHRAGQGAKLTAAAVAAGISLTIARTWPGGRAAERHIKGRAIGSRGLARYCPVCHPMPRIRQWAGGGPF